MNSLKTFKVTVLVENAYSDGHKSQATIPLKAPFDPFILEMWWEEVVFPLTGDGHGKSHGRGSCYTATILTGPKMLVGKKHEWMD